MYILYVYSVMYTPQTQLIFSQVNNRGNRKTLPLLDLLLILKKNKTKCWPDTLNIYSECVFFV